MKRLTPCLNPIEKTILICVMHSDGRAPALSEVNQRFGLRCRISQGFSATTCNPARSAASTIKGTSDIGGRQSHAIWAVVDRSASEIRDRKSSRSP